MFVCVCVSVLVLMTQNFVPVTVRTNTSELVISTYLFQ